MITLYYAQNACSVATHIVLEWVGAPYQLEKVGLHPKTDNLLAISPQGAVPVIKEGDWVLTQNVAILNYLAETYKDAELGGATPKEHAEVHRWLGMLNSDVHPTFKPLFGSTAYLEDEAAIAKTQQHAKELIVQRLAWFDAPLRSKDYLTGKRSIADAYLFVVLRWTELLGLELSGLDGLKAFKARMEQDPVVQKVLAVQA